MVMNGDSGIFECLVLNLAALDIKLRTCDPILALLDAKSILHRFFFELAVSSRVE